jgi:SPP1 gp7 family putative phage head morphogenesis protein
MPQTQDLPPLPDNARLKLLPPAEAVEFFKTKGLKRTTDWRDLWQEEHAMQFTVAKLTRLDLLQAVHDGVRAAVEEGITLSQFQKRLTPMLQKAGWWGDKERIIKNTGEIVTVKLGSPQRLALIYDVNLRTAYAAGRWQRIQGNKDSHGILVYRTMKDARVRPLHRSWEGVALPVDHAFWLTHYPPNGWRCRCLAYAVDDDGLAELKQRGPISEKAPPVVNREWLNHKTGEIIKVPFGIDPGWAYNPGIAGMRAAELQRAAAAKLLASANPLAVEAAADLIQGDAFARFYTSPTGTFPVAVMGGELQTQLAAQSSLVQLSAESMAAQKAMHVDIGLDALRRLPDMVRNGMIVTQGEKTLLFLRDGDVLYKAILKPSNDGTDLYVSTLSRILQNQLDQDLTQGKLVRGWP